jgi:hypothetical protein
MDATTAAEPTAETPTDAEPVVLQVLDPRTFRKNRIIDINIGDGYIVKAKKLDLTTMMFEGLLPMPVLTAVQRLITAGGDEMSPAERVKFLEDNDRKAMLELLRRHACTAVIMPVLTMTDDGNPDHLVVDMLSIEALTEIFTQTTLLPTHNSAEVARFRGRAALVPEHDALPREDVRPAPEPVVPAVELQHA